MYSVNAVDMRTVNADNTLHIRTRPDTKERRQSKEDRERKRKRKNKSKAIHKSKIDSKEISELIWNA